MKDDAGRECQSFLDKVSLSGSPTARGWKNQGKPPRSYATMGSPKRHSISSTIGGTRASRRPSDPGALQKMVSYTTDDLGVRSSTAEYPYQATFQDTASIAQQQELASRRERLKLVLDNFTIQGGPVSSQVLVATSSGGVLSPKEEGVELQWYRSCPNTDNFTQLETLTGPWYQPSADDIGSCILARCAPTDIVSKELEMQDKTRFAEVGPIVVDPEVRSRVEDAVCQKSALFLGMRTLQEDRLSQGKDGKRPLQGKALSGTSTSLSETSTGNAGPPMPLENVSWSIICDYRRIRLAAQDALIPPMESKYTEDVKVILHPENCRKITIYFDAYKYVELMVTDTKTRDVIACVIRAFRDRWLERMKAVQSGALPEGLEAWDGSTVPPAGENTPIEAPDPAILLESVKLPWSTTSLQSPSKQGKGSRREVDRFGPALSSDITVHSTEHSLLKSGTVSEDIVPSSSCVSLSGLTECEEEGAIPISSTLLSDVDELIAASQSCTDMRRLPNSDALELEKAIHHSGEVRARDGSSEGMPTELKLDLLELQRQQIQRLEGEVNQLKFQLQTKEVDTEAELSTRVADGVADVLSQLVTATSEREAALRDLQNKQRAWEQEKAEYMRTIRWQSEELSRRKLHSGRGSSSPAESPRSATPVTEVFSPSNGQV